MAGVCYCAARTVIARAVEVRGGRHAHAFVLCLLCDFMVFQALALTNAQNTLLFCTEYNCLAVSVIRSVSYASCPSNAVLPVPSGVVAEVHRTGVG